MKSLIIIISMFFAGSFTPTTLLDCTQNYNEETEVVNETAKKPKVTVVFDIGRKKRDCHRVGICKVSIVLGKVSDEGGGNSVGGYASVRDGRLELEALKSTIDRELLSKIFASDVFVMEEDFEIPIEVVEALNLKRNVIRRGVYDMKNKGESFVINF